MAISATRQVTVSLSGDVSAGLSFAAITNGNSPGILLSYTLAAGNNTITLPAGFVTGATIIPPSGNTQTIQLKGINADTGVALSLSDPTSIGFGTLPASIVLTAGGAIVALRILWT